MMESLRGGGPINSIFFGEKMSSSECLEQAAAAMDYHPQVSFVQMLYGTAATQSEEKREDEPEEDKKLVHFQIQQRFDFQRLLEIQERYKRMNPIPKIESFCPPPPADSCVNHALPPPVGPIAGANKERKKRKRTRAPPPSTRNPQEVESQRMNHIAVERNRRRLMNSYLATLSSLMPSSFVQRGDQASIVAGAIDFVKELEQLLLSLQAKKRMRAVGDATATATTSSSTSSSCTNDDDDACHVPAGAAASAVSEFFISPQFTGYTGNRRGGHEGVDVEATVVQGHVNLKVVGRRRRGQLMRAVAALEEIGLTVLHLNVTSLDHYSILCSLNLKIEEECKLGSADEIATAVHQIFTYISACCDCQMTTPHSKGHSLDRIVD